MLGNLPVCRFSQTEPGGVGSFQGAIGKSDRSCDGRPLPLDQPLNPAQSVLAASG